MFIVLIMQFIKVHLKEERLILLKGCARYNLVLSVTFYKMFSIMHQKYYNK